MKLAEVRRSRGMTQADLAQLMGLHRSSIAAVENGHTSAWPKFREQAARLLGVSEIELFDIDGEGPSD